MSLLNTCKIIPSYYYIASLGWISRSFAAASKVLAISIVLNYLGTDLYAVFVLITGLITWFTLVDFGLGKSLQNYISEARANNLDVHVVMSNAVILLLLLSVVAVIGYSIISYPIQYLLLHRIAYTVATTQWYLLLVIGNIYILTTLLSISFNVFFAEFRAYWTYIYQLIGPLGSVFCTIMFKYYYVGNNKLFGVLLAWVLPPLVVAIIAYFHAFPSKRIFVYYQRDIFRHMLFRSIKFWGFAVGSVATLGFNYLIMAQTLTARDITIYNILDRGYNVIFFVYQAILAVIWPVLSELFIKKKWHEANRLLVRNIWLGFVIVIVCTGLLLFSKGIIIELLASGKNIILPIGGIMLFGSYYFLRVISEAYAVGLQSQNKLKIFWICLPFQAILGVAGMYWFSLHFGLNGILLGLMFSLLLTAVWVFPWVYFKNKVFHC